jgi:DNA polymerase-3 subunit beta
VKLHAKASSLKSIMDASASIAPKLNRRPQLECTRIDVDGNVAIFTATNLQQTSRLQFTDPDAFMEDGSVYLPSVNLQRIIKEAKNEEVQIEWDGSSASARVRFGTVGINLPIEPPDNLPAIPCFAKTVPYITLNGRIMGGVLARTGYAVQEKFQARALGSVSIKVRGPLLEAAATDGTRIAIVRVPVANPNGADGDALLPPAKPASIKWIAPEKEDDVDVQVSRSTIRMRGPRGELTWRLMSGFFPDYEGHVPENQPMTAEMDRRTYLALLERSKLLQVVSLPEYLFTVRSNELEMVASAGIDGQVTATAEFPWTWDDLEISLDPNLIIDSVKAMSGERISLGFQAGDQPMLLREITTDYDYRVAIVPRFR